MEAILTFFLVFVIYGTAVDRRTPKAVAGLAIGLTITMDISRRRYVRRGDEPGARLRPGLVGHHWAHWWIWYVGPLAGAVIAASTYELLYLRPDDGASRRGHP